MRSRSTDGRESTPRLERGKKAHVDALAALRLTELELGDPLETFTRESLMQVHHYILQDSYEWAGQLRNQEVGAMGLPMCRAAFVDAQLDDVMRNIQRHPPSTEDPDSAVKALAEHWGELTLVHPFLDGNSRTQRYFFDHMLRNAGWGINWEKVNSAEVHAARYVAAATVDSTYLAEALRPGLASGDDIRRGTLSKPQRNSRTKESGEIFLEMMVFRRENPGKSFHEHVHTSEST